MTQYHQIPPHDNTVCRIDGIKITDFVGEILSKKTINKELKYFLQSRWILHSNIFDPVYRKRFECMATGVTHHLNLWVEKIVSGLFATNDMRYKWK